MPASPPPRLEPLSDAEIERLQALLDQLPAPLQPLDVSALDGYLCGVLLQPAAVAEARWRPVVTDLEGRPLPADFPAEPLFELVRRRHRELEAAITRRDWFDPWVFPPEDPGASPSEALLPWVAGFAAAQNRFPELQACDDPALHEPLALLYLHVDPADLEDADELLALIDTLEPPHDLAEAVQDLVRAVMLIADVTRPRRTASTHARPARARRSPGGRH